MGAPRTVTHHSEIMDTVEELQESKPMGYKSRVKSILKENSMRGFRNPLYCSAIGAGERGIHGATPPENLHVVEGGKWALKCLLPPHPTPPLRPHITHRAPPLLIPIHAPSYQTPPLCPVFLQV